MFGSPIKQARSLSMFLFCFGVRVALTSKRKRHSSRLAAGRLCQVQAAARLTPCLDLSNKKLCSIIDKTGPPVEDSAPEGSSKQSRGCPTRLEARLEV